MNSPLIFAPTDAALAERIAAIDIHMYGVSRNKLDGAVTRLSPWLTHGFLDLRDLQRRLERDKNLKVTDKLTSEFGWHDFFAHVAGHLGEGILSDIRPALPGVEYAPELPADIREGRTGVPAIDQSVRALYRDGWLHNHARMWLASYVVHIRHVHWRAGADWMVGHLLDGDLASNHLSWQWIAATFSQKPYLFNAENVAKFAPADWHSAGTVIDASYEALEQIARGTVAASGIGATPADAAASIAEPALFAAPPADILAACLQRVTLPCFNTATDLRALNSWLAKGPRQRVELIHPWALAPRDRRMTSGLPLRIAAIHLPFHARFPWSARRWQFVLARMVDVCDAVVIGDLAVMQKQLADRPEVVARTTSNPDYAPVLDQLGARLEPVPTSYPAPEQLCTSFNQFWKAVTPPVQSGRRKREDD